MICAVLGVITAAGIVLAWRGSRGGVTAIIVTRLLSAMAALPAQFEGVMRNHMIVSEIGQRDSAFYSVIDSEWPQVRANLERRLAAT